MSIYEKYFFWFINKNPRQQKYAKYNYFKDKNIHTIEFMIILG